MSLTTGIRKEGIGLIFPLFLLAQRKEEEEEAHREAERRAEREDEREAERMLGDRYE
jgi:hypothetical protein